MRAGGGARDVAAGFEREAALFYRTHAWLNAEIAALRTQLALRAYDPNQPRVPAGNPDGGQWTGGVPTNANSRQAGQNRRVQLAGDITGFKKHGINQAINRGVSPAAIRDAVANPLKLRPRANGTTQYVGRDATVVLNPAGEVVTVWPR